MATNYSFHKQRKGDDLDITPYVEHATATQELQKSLQTKEVINNFYDYTKKAISISGVKYYSEKPKIDLLFGDEGSEQLIFSLILEDTDMGEISFYSNKAFTDRDHSYIKQMLDVLIYPLRNSIIFYTTLQESLLDPLTQISNRKSLDKELMTEIALVKRHGTKSSILLIDLDKFKKINDILGHLAGDELLSNFSEALKKLCRNSDDCFRYGGDEFIVLARNTNIQSANFLAQRILDVTKLILEQYNKQLPEGINASISIGLTSISAKDSQQSLLQRADNALYVAKNKGGDQVYVMDKINRN